MEVKNGHPLLSREEKTEKKDIHLLVEKFMGVLFLVEKFMGVLFSFW